MEWIRSLRFVSRGNTNILAIWERAEDDDYFRDVPSIVVEVLQQCELHGGHENNAHNGNLEMGAMVSEHDMVSSDVGHRVENVALDDAENLGEELFAEGMDEAVHEQMLAARRAEPKEDEEEA